MITFYCLSFPNRSVETPLFSILNFEPKGAFAALAWAVEDLLLLGKDDEVGHGAHLGGYLFGVLVWSFRSKDVILSQLRKSLIKMLCVTEEDLEH